MKSMILVLAFLPAVAFGGGVQRVLPADPERTLWSFTVALSSSADLGGYKLPTERGFTIEGVTIKVSTLSGGGAGNTVITITDGTNTCTATFTCATTQAAGPHRAVMANGAGTGCAYPAGAAISASVTTAGCTTTQPTARTIEFVGDWR